MKEAVLKLLQQRLEIVEHCIDEVIEQLPFGLEWAQMCSLDPYLTKYSQQKTEIEQCIDWVKGL
jgi:hypothetical protein